MKKEIALIALVALTACNKKKFFDGPDSYQDGFESYSTFEELLPGDDTYWSFTQQTIDGNELALDATHVHTGSKALKCNAAASENGKVSKCSISKQNMAFWKNETVHISVWYYLEGTQDLNWLFLADLEEQTAIGAGPGMRLAIVDNQLRVEHKFFEKDLLQIPGQEIDFPRNQWVNVVWEVKLSRKEKGSVRIWQNGQLILEKDKVRTLPNDFLYSQQGTKGMYSSIEFGITANSYDNPATLWIDDVDVHLSE